MERFPTKYLRLTTRLLAQMKESMPAPAVTKLFSQVAEEMANDYSEQMKGLSMEERLDFVKAMLAHEGFTVEWEKKGNDYQIHEISCPYYQIGVTHPEVQPDNTVLTLGFRPTSGDLWVWYMNGTAQTGAAGLSV